MEISIREAGFPIRRSTHRRRARRDRAGKYVREIGKETYGFMTAAQVRVDPADNIWAVDEMSNMVMKWNPEGRVAMLLGRKAEAESLPPRTGAGDGAGQSTDLFIQPAHRCGVGRGRQYLRRRWGRQRAHRQVR